MKRWFLLFFFATCSLLSFDVPQKQAVDAKMGEVIAEEAEGDALFLHSEIARLVHGNDELAASLIALSTVIVNTYSGSTGVMSYYLQDQLGKSLAIIAQKEQQTFLQRAVISALLAASLFDLSGTTTTGVLGALQTTALSVAKRSGAYERVASAATGVKASVWNALGWDVSEAEG